MVRERMRKDSRDRVTLTSYEDDAIRTKLGNCADTLPTLASG